MAAEVCVDRSNASSEWPSSSPASPRISFSVDLSPTDLSVDVDVKSPRKDSTLDDEDFDFSVSREVISIHEPSSADELFSGGKLVPQPIRTSSAGVDADSAGHLKRGTLREIMDSHNEQQQDVAVEARPPLTPTINQRSSFWRFSRSTSVGDGDAAAASLPERVHFFCPFPLYRSKSVGSKPNPDPNPNATPKRRHYFSKSTSSSCTAAAGGGAAKTYYYSGSQRGGVRISPVLNVPPAPLLPRANSYYNSDNGNYNNYYNSNIITYLLCSCSTRNMRKTAMACSSP